MNAATIIDVEPIVWTFILLGLFATVLGAVLILNAIIKDIVYRLRRRRRGTWGRA